MKINIPIYLIIHHTSGTESNPRVDTSNQTFEDVNAWHRTNPNTWLGEYSSLGFAIGYHYFIDKTGKVTQGRGDTDEGAHCIGKNTQSLGICLAGNFDVTMPTNEQVTSLKRLILAKQTEYDIPAEKVVPHRKFANKSCYGSLLSNDWVQKLVTVYPTSFPCVEQEKVINRLQEVIKSIISYWTNK